MAKIDDGYFGYCVVSVLVEVRVRCYGNMDRLGGFFRGEDVRGKDRYAVVGVCLF